MSPPRFGIQCMLVMLGMLFVSGSIMFAIGYDKAYIRNPLPAYASWRHTRAVIENSRFTPTKGGATGSCAAEFWFVVSHTGKGLLEKPERISSWGEVHASTTHKLCSALQTKKMIIYYDTRKPDNVMIPAVFEAEKDLTKSQHSYGSTVFWIGVAFVSASLLPLIVWLAALVTQGFRHMKASSEMTSEPGYGATTKADDGI